MAKNGETEVTLNGKYIGKLTGNIGRHGRVEIEFPNGKRIFRPNTQAAKETLIKMAKQDKYQK